jgi:hypothetical protein
MRLLPRRVCLGDAGPRFAKPEAELAKQPLALSHPQLNSILAADPGGQRFAIPQVSCQPYLARHPAENYTDLTELLLIKASGPAWPLAFVQPGQTSLFEAPYPIFD